MTTTAEDLAAWQRAHDEAPERNPEAEPAVDPLLTVAADKNPLADLSREEQVKRLAEMIADCETHDAQVRPFKQCISVLEKAGIPPATVWALLFQQLEWYANGLLPPTLANQMLRDAEKKWGVKRDVTAEAATRANLIGGSNVSRAIKDRIAEAEKELEAAQTPTPIPADALAYAMSRHRELRRLLLSLTEG